MYKPLILVVDDEADILEIITDKLEKAGFRVEITNEAEHMLEKAMALKPDLILLDINMPRISGTEAIIDLKSHPELKKIKVAFLTSLSAPWPGTINEENLAHELGAVAYLRKDKDLENLGSKLIDILKNS
ncbi:MAG: response regulator [bacterium]|nr:response regulator [bacterium]